MIRRFANASTLAFALGATFLAQVAQADTVTLKNGREIHGRLIEERRESIRMRTEGGTITIQKAEIASFTEGEVFFNYGGPARTQEQVDAAQPTTPGQPGQSGQPAQPGEQPRPGQPAPGTTTDWRWPANLSAEKIEQLTPIRDAVLKQLEEIGPTAEERLKAIAVSGEERSRIQELVGRFDWQRRQGSANLQRTQARDNVVEFGVKAIPFLVEALKQEAQWTKRIAAQAIERLAKAAPPPQTPPAVEGQPMPKPLTLADVKWLLYHHDTLSALVALLDHQGEVDSPFVRADANAALEAVTGRSGSWERGTEPLRSAAESRARDSWETWTKAEKQRWVAAEAEKEKTRVALLKKLDLLKQGKNPDEQPQ